MVAGRMKLDQLGSFIREQRRSARLSLRKPSAEILQQIAKALRISAETLYVQAGILDENRDHDLVAEILKDSSMTERQKQALIDHYRSYVESNVEPFERAATVQDVIEE